MGRRNRKKGIKHPRRGKRSQNVSPSANAQSAENRDARMTSVEEMDVEGELKVENNSSLEPDDEHPPPERMQKEPEDTLPDSTGSQDWVLPKKTKKKKKKKNRNASNSELQAVLNPAPSSLDYSLHSETAGGNNPAEQSQDELAKMIKPDRGAIDEDRHWNQSCGTLDLDRGPENGAKNNSGGSDIKINSEQVQSKDGKNAGATTTGDEKEKSNINVVGQRACSREQNNIHSSVIEEPLENVTASSTGNAKPHTSTGGAENISSDLHLNVKSFENTGTNSSGEDQTQIKRSLPENKTKQACKTKVEREAKQQRSDLDEKTVKLEEKVDEVDNACEKVIQREETEKKGEAAAVSNQKNKKQLRKRSQVSSQVNSEDGITVYFHAILSKDFKLDLKNHKVFVRAEGISGYSNWQDNVCELTCSKSLGGHGYLFDGFVNISKDNVNKPIPYKYYVSRGKKGEYEFIYKVRQDAAYVNRYMCILSDELSGTDWHQYDDIICAKPPEGVFQYIKDRIPGLKNSEKKVANGKYIAAKEMLEVLFSILNNWSPINVKNFFRQFHQFYLVNKKPMVHENGPKEWTALNFGEEQVKQLICSSLRETGRQILNQKSQTKLGWALIILLLRQRYHLETSKEDLTFICILLCLEKPRAHAVDEINFIKDVFSEYPWYMLHHLGLEN